MQIQFIRQPGFLQGRDKFRRGNHTFFRIVPPRQRFPGTDPVVDQADNRLNPGTDMSAGDGAVQMIRNILHPGPVPRGTRAQVSQFPADILAPVEGFLVGIHILIRAAEERQEIRIPLRIKHCEAFGNRQFRVRMNRMTVLLKNGILQERL